MKKIIFLLLIIHCSLIITNAQWVQTAFTNNYSATDIEATDSSIHIAFLQYGIYRSYDNGNSVTALNNGLPGLLQIPCVKIKDSMMYAGNLYDGIYKSTNNGLNWFSINDSSTNSLCVYDIFKFNQSLFIGTTNSIFMSTNEGLNWISIRNNLPITWMPVVFYYSNKIFAGGYYNGLYTSTNVGTNWTKCQNGFPDSCGVSDYTIINNVLFISTFQNGIFKSSDYGFSWVDCSQGLSRHVESICSSSNLLFTSTGLVVSYSSNYGQSWIPINNNGITGAFEVYRIKSNSQYLFAGTYSNGVWRRSISDIITTYSISGTVRYTDNNQPVTSGVVKAIKLNQNDASIIVYDTAIIQSNGTYILPNVPQDSVYIGLYPNSNTTPDYVISYYPSATDWHQATGLYPTSNLTNIDLGAIRIQSTTASNSVNGKVMRLTNSMIGNLKDAVLYAKNGNTFVKCSTSDINGIYHLPSLPTGNLKIIVNRLGFSNDSTTVNITSSSNIDSINFNLFNNYTGIKPITGEVPTDFKLYQNYPNPFNPVTKIKFDVAAHSVGQTFLSVYDLLGREIQTLVNEKLNPGTYEVTFDGSKFASGVYFYQLRTGDFVNTKRMMMIK